jgi:hypothetical protein
VFEFARTNNWMGAVVSPSVAQSLAPSVAESDAMLAGRVVGDVLTIAVGIAEVSGGIGVAGGGIAVGCGTTLCLASAPAAAAGLAISGYGVGTALSGAGGLGENLGRMYSKRSKNDLKPDPDATGPHSTFKRDPTSGKVSNYRTWDPNPQNPSNPWNSILGYDGVGSEHFNKYDKEYYGTPHVHDPSSPGGLRYPRRGEIPGE